MCMLDGGAVTQPTEPIPFVPPPPNRATPRESWFRRHATSMAAIAVAIAVAAVAIWFGATAALSGDSTWTAVSAAPPEMASATPTPVATSTGKGASAAGARTIVRAVIVNQSSSTWTVRTRADALTRITITPRTRFGPDGTAGASNRFRPGEDVVILGAVANGLVTADWVIAARPHRSAVSATP